MNGKVQNNNNSSFDSAITCLNRHIQGILQNTPEQIKAQAQEIRLRANMPLVLFCGNRSYFYDENGIVLSNYDARALTPSLNDIKESFNNICNYSVYSYQHQLKEGFITVKGGHRVGICATAVYQDNRINTIRDISSLNIRIARQIKGIAEPILSQVDFIRSGVLIAGKPSSGKTTLLRDISRSLSLKLIKLAVIDERGELAAMTGATMGNDLGFCDVLNDYKKTDAIEIAIRALSPDIIVCDELGNIDEIKFITLSVNSGVKLIATIHAGSYEELLRKPQTKAILDTGAFNTVVVLDDSRNPGKIKSIHKVG